MAAVTVASLATALRVEATDARLSQVFSVSISIADIRAPNLPEAIRNEVVTRLAAYLFDQPEASAGAGYSSAWRNSGAASIAAPWISRRGEVVGQELDPDTPAAPPAPHGTANIEDGSVTQAKLADGAVTSRKLGNSAVTRTKLGAGAVTGDAIEDGTIGGRKLADGTITQSKLAGSIVHGPSHIIPGSITAIELADGLAFADPKVRPANYDVNLAPVGVSVLPDSTLNGPETNGGYGLLTLRIHSVVTSHLGQLAITGDGRLWIRTTPNASFAGRAWREVGASEQGHRAEQARFQNIDLGPADFAGLDAGQAKDRYIFTVAFPGELDDNAFVAMALEATNPTTHSRQFIFSLPTVPWEDINLLENNANGGAVSAANQLPRGTVQTPRSLQVGAYHVSGFSDSSVGSHIFAEIPRAVLPGTGAGQSGSNFKFSVFTYSGYEQG